VCVIDPNCSLLVKLNKVKIKIYFMISKPGGFDTA